MKSFNITNEHLIDIETKKALALMSKPLKDKLASVQNKVSDTLTILEKLQVKLARG